MNSIPRKVRIAILGVLAMTAVLVPVGPASAQTLNGVWEPFTRCPVDRPAMLAADGVSSDPACIAANSPNGSIKLGNSTQTTGATNLQLGATIDNATGAFCGRQRRACARPAPLCQHRDGERKAPEPSTGARSIHRIRSHTQAADT